MKFLITGCGGDIAIAIARILRESVPDCWLLGSDIHSDHAGFAFFDSVTVVERASHPQYMERMHLLCRDHAIDVLVPTSEAELAQFMNADAAVLSELPLVLMADGRSLAVGLDKWLTFNHLTEHGIVTPGTGIIGQHAPPAPPFIVKQRSGQGSKGLQLITSSAQMDVLPHHQGWLWQNYLPDDGEEYTCGLFAAPGIVPRTMILRRRLQGGLTGSGEVIDDDRIETALAAVASSLDLVGAINVQLRMNDGVPSIFEINARFSSTVGFRHRLGFRDFLWSLQHALGLPIEPYEAANAGARIYRVGSEIIRFP